MPLSHIWCQEWDANAFQMLSTRMPKRKPLKKVRSYPLDDEPEGIGYDTGGKLEESPGEEPEAPDLKALQQLIQQAMPSQ